MVEDHLGHPWVWGLQHGGFTWCLIFFSANFSQLLIIDYFCHFYKLRFGQLVASFRLFFGYIFQISAKFSQISPNSSNFKLFSNYFLLFHSPRSSSFKLFPH